MDDPKILDFQSRLAKRLADEQAEGDQFDCKANILLILAEAIRIMRRAGAHDQDIASLLQYAASELWEDRGV